MANRKATLIYYGNVLNVGWRRGPLVQSKNGKIKPGWLRYQGGDHQCTTGVYQIRHYVGSKVKHTPVGSDLDAAQTALTVFEKKLQYDALKQDLGIEMPDANKLERKTLAQLRKTYIEKYAHGSPDTIYNHTFNGTEFTRLLAERGKTYAEDVIEDAGYAVTSFPSTFDALRKLSGIGDAFDIVVICDCIPAEERSRFIATIKATSPTTPILLIGEEREPLTDDAVRGLDGPEALLNHVAGLLAA